MGNDPPKLYFDNNHIDQHSTHFFTDTVIEKLIVIRSAEMAEIQPQIATKFLRQGRTSF
jgi:hypothetical protein